jgi:hypothetical protein
MVPEAQQRARATRSRREMRDSVAHSSPRQLEERFLTTGTGTLENKRPKILTDSSTNEATNERGRDQNPPK